MTHVLELIHRSLEGDIAPAEQLQLAQHLGVCRTCRELSTELRRNDVMLAKREPMPAVPPRREARRQPLAFVRPALIGVATLVFALVAGTQLAGWRANTSPASSGTSAPLGVAGRGDVGVCAAARQQVFGVTRLDRMESKRMSMKDLMDGAGGDWPTRWTTQPEATLRSLMVCVVAVSGEIRAQMGLIDTGPYKWGLFFSVAGSNETIGTRLGSDANWPPTFDALPDRRGAPYPGYVVEIVGPQTVRVKLESPMLSQEFGDPTLLRADRFTEVLPAAPTIAATGVRAGDRVQVVFERDGRDPASGAYPLSVFRVVAETAQPVQNPVGGAMPCPSGQLPILHIAFPSPPGDAPGMGSASAEAAFRKRYPTVTDFTMYPLGSERPATSAAELGRGPVWIVAGKDTYIAQAPGAGGANDWFAYPATFAGCRAPSPESLRTWVAESALNVEGYGFSVRIMSDPAYGPQPSAGPWAVSAVPGIGLSCTWTRTGPDIATVQDLWGTPQSVASTAGYTDVRTGRGGTRQNGIPLAAVTGSTATTVCGVRDATGPHGVVIELAIAADGRYTDGSLRLSQWSGVAAEATPSPRATPVALGPITPADVAAGMPAGAAIFARTDPTCVPDTDGKTYRCVLGSPPAPELSDFLGTKELLVIGGAVAGGCVGLGHDGMTWNCFVGLEAVDRGIIGKDLLGQPAPVPGRG